jgi:SAM-dependent methyltransferase
VFSPLRKHLSIEKQFDLITVAQAIHWFRFDDFYAEVKRTLKPGGIIAVIGYGPIQTIEPLQDIIDHFYKNIIGPYWDAERHYIDELYQTIPFPFEEIKMPVFTMSYQWTLAQLIGYLNTWSAVKHYKTAPNRSGYIIQKELSDAWPAAPSITFSFPLLTRIGS